MQPRLHTTCNLYKENENVKLGILSKVTALLCCALHRNAVIFMQLCIIILYISLVILG